MYLSSARATFVMRGPAALFGVVDTCVPLLEDGAGIDELVDAIGSERARPLVSHLIQTLTERHLVLLVDQLAVPEPSDGQRERFAETLAYLETFRDDPYRDFLRVRQARVLLSGPAEALGTAARGLVRAGVGQVLIATTEPGRLRGLASRHPEVRLLECPDDQVATLARASRLDAAVIFTEDNFPTEAIGDLPAACLAVPVQLGKDLVIVGPALSRRDTLGGVERLWSRAASWSRLAGDDLLVRPSGDLLAGALASQLTLDGLIGLNPGRVHLIHGPDLRSDSIAPPLAGDAELEVPTDFGTGRQDAGDGDGDGAGHGTAWRDVCSSRWSGLFRLHVPGDLPQMPLALTVADGRTRGFDGRAVGFGGDQEAATSEAALEALRRHVTGRQQHQPGPWRESAAWATGAAGRDETRWLLDGALRLLSGRAGQDQPVAWMGLEDLEVRRLWRALEEHELTPVRLVRRRLLGFGWTLVSVHDRRTQALLASGWGPTGAVGAAAALSSTLATQQVRRSIDAGYEGPGGEAGYLEHFHGPHRSELAGAVAAWLDHAGLRLQGRRLRRDPVAGPIDVACGTVWLDG